MTDPSRAIHFVQRVYQTLLYQSDLSPANEIVTNCLKSFVSFLSANHQKEWGASLPDAPELAEAASHLPLLCAAAEREMEKWWCRRLLADGVVSPHALKAFWYFENYRHLVEAELSLLGPAIGGRATFLGSGALPLSAILFAALVPELHILCVDKDEEACALASALVQRLRIGGRIEIIQELAEQMSIPAGEPVICASLLDAPKLYDAFVRRGVSIFITRDAEGLFRLCYKPAPLPPETYRLIGRTVPASSRINTSRLFVEAKRSAAAITSFA